MSYRHQNKYVALGWADLIPNPPADDIVALRILGRFPVKVHVAARDATLALEAALRATGYEYPTDYIGSLSVRAIAGTSTWSAHAYPLAIDLDYGGDNPESPDHPGIDKNPHLHEPIPRGFVSDPRFQITEAQVNAVEAIRTNSGARVWRWLGWSIGDTMHFEIRCTLADLQSGIAGDFTIPEGDDEDMAIIRDGDRSELVRMYQEGLQGFDGALLPKYGPDGDYGSESIAGTNALQAFLGEQVTPDVSSAVFAAALSFRPVPVIAPPDAGGALANARLDELVTQLGAVHV